MPLLSRRQREVCVMILLGLNSKEAGVRLGLSHRTVEWYREQVLAKYECKTAAQLIFKLFKAYT